MKNLYCCSQSAYLLLLGFFFIIIIFTILHFFLVSSFHRTSTPIVKHSYNNRCILEGDFAPSTLWPEWTFMFIYGLCFTLFFFLSCRQLRDGSLDDNQLMQGSRLTLLPSVETGLLVSRSSFSSFISQTLPPFPPFW